MPHPKQRKPEVRQAETQQHFPCDQCGADLLFTPGAHHLQCNYCGHQNQLPEHTAVIHEYDLETALDSLAKSKLHTLDSTQVIKCPNCASAFELKVNQHSGDCPFCGTPVVTGTEQSRLFQPKSLLPFKINEKQAQAAFEKWIGRLWFAPSALKDKAKRDEKLLGIYIPYWTYDSQTDTTYRGERGTVYYERRVVNRIVNGKARRQVVNVPRVRWNPVSGRVKQFFDDILVGASRSLPRKILDSIHPWDTDNLVPYDQAYLSGFQSEIYQVDLDSGYEHARQLMNHAIRQSIRHDIGGDQQRIHSLHTHHSHTTFKHILLPVWSAAFRYQNKTYRFVINGRNGRTQGERPYSKIKIALTALFVITGLLGAFYYLESSGLLEEILRNSAYSYSSGYY